MRAKKFTPFQYRIYELSGYEIQEKKKKKKKKNEQSVLIPYMGLSDFYTNVLNCLVFPHYLIYPLCPIATDIQVRPIRH